MPDDVITVDALIDAMIEQRRYRNASPDLSGYHNLRVDPLLIMFGIDIEQRASELNSEARAAISAGTYSLIAPIDQIELSPFQGTIVRSLLNRCLDKAIQTTNPFFGYAGTVPPRFERNLFAIYGTQLLEYERELAKLYRTILRDVLVYMFPGIERRRFPIEQIYEMGLSRETPNPNDYL